MRTAFFCLFLTLLSVSSIAQENLIIDKIKFKGNKHIANSKLKEEITIESSSWIKEKILKKEPVYFTYKLYNDDIKRLKIFYQKQGYLKVAFGEPKVVVNKKNKVELIVFVTEGKPVLISEISFLVDSAQTLQEVLHPRNKKNLLLQTKATKTKIFRDESLTKDKLLIAEAFYDEGYPYTLVIPQLEVDTLNNSTKIKWTIDRGPLSYFGSTIIKGNSRVPSKSIHRQLAYKKGDVWSKERIDQTQKQIYNQGNFRVASVKTQIGTEQLDTLPLQIQINEAPRWTTRFGVGYGREDRFRTFADIQYLSFITNAGRLNLYAKHSGLEPYNLYVKFSQPSFIFPMNTLTLHPFMQRQNEPGYKLDKIGFNITFFQNFSEELNTSIGFIFEDIELDTTNINEFELPSEEESFYKKSGFVLGGIYNTADPVLDPVQGYTFSFNIKTNDFFIDKEMPFYRILAELKTYIGVKKGIVLGLKAKGGGIQRTDDNSFIPIEERFFAGGSHSVRGWSRSELGPKDKDGIPVGGNSLFETSAELRFDIGRKLKLALFADAGNVWIESFTYHINDLHYAAGVGIKIKTPIGPAGLDFARPIFDKEKQWQIHFNIGHTF